jgi:uncharacterized protein YcbK (DUF882 family)
MSRRSPLVVAAVASAAALCLAATPLRATPPSHPDIAAVQDTSTVLLAGRPVLPKSATGTAADGEPGQGLSGKLRVAIVRALDALDLPFVEKQETAEGATYRWVPLFGTREDRLLGASPFGERVSAPSRPGVWRLLVQGGGWSSNSAAELAVITQVPFTEKKGAVLNGYRIGRYPVEGSGRTDRYAPPSGFIEVTPENKDLQISEHFRLGQFVTKNQHDVWPKYVALDMRLIDKLELVMQELNAMGIRAERMHVMSGYRTPEYNGPGEGGRAKLSRHTYGDAADVWIDNEGDGYISDLNGDGRRDIEDAKLILRAVDRVEQKYPELVGGTGIYLDNGAHGPFVHIDVRGTLSRW